MAIIIKPMITGDDDPRLKAQLEFSGLDRNEVIIIHHEADNKTAIIDDRKRFPKPG